MDTSEIQTHIEAVEADGYTILEDAFSEEQVEAMLALVRETEANTLTPLEPGEVEDDSSIVRTGALLKLDPMFWDIPINESVCAVLDGVLGEDYLLSQISAIDIKPENESLQPLHPDDALVPVPRPHERPIGATAMLVVTPFSEHTGGTRLLPGSHKESLDLLYTQDPERLAQTIQPECKPGTVILFDHALFHGAADNRSDTWRLGIQSSYHAGWIRPYTNWFRSMPIEQVREMPEKLRDLLGYKTYNGIGGAHGDPESYRESYLGKGRKRDPRLSLA